MKEDIRSKLIRYRQGCSRVLWKAFRDDILPSDDPAYLVPDEMTPAERALAMAETLTAIARHQVALEQCIDSQDYQMDRFRDFAGDTLKILPVAFKRYRIVRTTEQVIGKKRTYGIGYSLGDCSFFVASLTRIRPSLLCPAVP